jgi:AAA domain
MVFWRAKSVKPAAADPPVAEENAASVENTVEAVGPTEVAASAPSETEAAQAEAPVAATVTPTATAKIISMLPARLSDRLAEAGGKSPAEEPVTVATPASAVTEASRDVAGTKLKDNSTGRQRSALRAVINDASPGSHVLVLGPAGTGRRSAAVGLAKEIAKTRPQPPDWVYVATGRHADVLHAHAVPAGMGERVVRDIHDALEKSSAMLTRLIASDTHQMTLAVLEEEHRHRSDGGLDQLKRRAEAQNIALVKTSEGFVLAPMHEGRVVRADVFRALPESLQRDVETKVTAFEAELQSLLVALPGNDVAIDDRHLAVAHEVAGRAVKPNLSVARKLFPNDAAVADVFDAIEADWTRRAVDVARRAGNSNTPLVLPGLHAVCAASDDGGAPVVLARSAGARDLIGEIGYGIDGAVAVRPGHLARANGGFLIIDAWRLAAEPQGWAALSAALETGLLQPASAPGLAVTAEALPLHVKLILIAENDSLAKLKDIDPRTEQYFGAVVRLEGAPTPLEAEQ